jgi:hypothetical protein
MNEWSLSISQKAWTRPLAERCKDWEEEEVPCLGSWRGGWRELYFPKQYSKVKLG